MSIQSTSAIMCREGIMPYNAGAYLYGGTPQAINYLQPEYMAPDSYVAEKPKKHIFGKIVALTAALLAGATIARKSKKANELMDKAKPYTDKAMDFAKKTGKNAWELTKKGAKTVRDWAANLVSKFRKPKP